MKKHLLTTASEILSWLALGFTFPITISLARRMLRDAPHLYTKIDNGDFPLPTITTFALNYAGALPFLSIAGIALCAVGIWLRRYEPIRNHQLFIITIGWVTLFQIFGTVVLAVWLPVVAIVPHSH